MIASASMPSARSSVKGADPGVVAVDEAEIVDVLQAQMARIVEDFRARMPVDQRQEALEGGAVMQILSRMRLEAQIDIGGICGIEHRPPNAGEFGERPLEQLRRRRRIGIEIRPGKASGKHRELAHRQPFGKGDGAAQILFGASLAREAIAENLRRREAIGQLVIGGMDGEQLAHPLGGEFADDEAVVGQQLLDLPDIGGIISAGDIQDARIMDRDLQCPEAEAAGKGGDIGKAVKQRRRADELRNEQRRPAHRGWSGRRFG